MNPYKTMNIYGPDEVNEYKGNTYATYTVQYLFNVFFFNLWLAMQFVLNSVLVDTFFA